MGEAEKLVERDAVFADDDGLWVRDDRGNCRPFDADDLEGIFADLQALQARAESAERELAKQTDRIGTHGPGCHTWGPRHYECALRRIAELETLTTEGSGHGS